jgi:Fe2+ or Zn2+ uptake regulation protein
VTVDRGATRFCPNMREHGHFHCAACETVFDVDLPAALPGVALPRGFLPQRYEMAVHGLCADCARKK